MRLQLTMACLLVVALSASAKAQDLPGLDLSTPPKEQTPSAEPAPDEQPPLDVSKPGKPGDGAQAPTARPAATDAEAAPKDLLPFSERDVALGDKVKAVQRKGFMKRGRFEIAPIFSTTVNDAFYQKFGGGLRLAYSLQDSFALALRGTYFTPYRTDNVREGKVALQSQLLTSQLNGMGMLDGVWSPIYGKAAFLARSIIHFDLYLAGGFGLVWTATSQAPRNEGPHVAADVGGGVRFYPTEWMAFELGMMATFYPDQPVASVPGTVQKVLVANVGFSFFFPTHFEYVYP